MSSNVVLSGRCISVKIVQICRNVVVTTNHFACLDGGVLVVLIEESDVIVLDFTDILQI